MVRTLICLAALPLAAQEPPPRRLTAAPLPTIDVPFATVTGVRELRDGRILVSDAKRATLHLIDPRTGKATLVGSAGGDSLQYAEPGGFYSGQGDTTFLLDRGLKRILSISQTGAIVGSRSIARLGTSSSSSLDVDLQRVDARGLAYFTDASMPRPRAEGRGIDSVPLIRFDARQQRGDTVATLRLGESFMTRIDEHASMTQGIFGSPLDEWGVAPDGRVAVVRGAPYRVEWYHADGHVTRGRAVAIDSIPFTDADRDAQTKASRDVLASGGMGAAGASRQNAAPRALQFAASKPAFELHGVIVAPDGRVWVARSRPFGAGTTIFDVFDDRGARVDRVELPARSRVIGFGAQTIYVDERDAGGKSVLKRYRLQSASR